MGSTTIQKEEEPLRPKGSGKLYILLAWIYFYKAYEILQEIFIKTLLGGIVAMLILRWFCSLLISRD
jgi:hypothetical protein